MAIERHANMLIDQEGNLRATTNWISKHDEGLAELLKNVRYAYLPHRSNVEAKHHVAAILLVDADESRPARIGVLDVGGATVDDLNRWSVWQDQRASLVEGMTQGNGGKAYLFRWFTGEGRLLGVRENKRNCKGFEGAAGSKERGTPGFMPSIATGREAPAGSVLAELDDALKPYRVTHDQLSAGAGDIKAGGVWARVRAEVEVVDNPNVKKTGGGFPTLKITERDVDPETGEKRASDPDEPPLWQTITDYKNNIWWLNLGSKEAEAAFSRRTDNPQAWRLYHAQKVVEMVVHVHMQSEFTARAEGEIPGLWTDHLQIYNTLQKQFIPLMWERLNSHAQTGAELE